ncbi:MAG: hypothetical protein KatS3mg029_0855 [Saprospiraceae bacterium]|nr:MAG: hypothetical protein KatS3mg029_0855 [Saprospiraceae bacterium]
MDLLTVIDLVLDFLAGGTAEVFVEETQLQ